MKKRLFVMTALVGFGLSASAMAADSGAIVGGAIGGGVGAAIGSEIGGKDGAIIGGAIGGATGAAIGSSDSGDQKVVVKETKIIVKEPRGGPPGHARGKKKGWDKHN
jgi:hypothetical protein